MVKTRTSVQEIPGWIPTIYKFTVWKESGAPPYKCACALLTFSKQLSRLLYNKHALSDGPNVDEILLDLFKTLDITKALIVQGPYHTSEVCEADYALQRFACDRERCIEGGIDTHHFRFRRIYF